MDRNSKGLLAAAVSIALGVPFAAHATNGMNLEGYGPIATGMGGASMAYDNGTAAVMNNPATLGLMNSGNRIDLAIGELRPDVSAETPMGGGMSESSGGDSYLMPALGWAHKADKLTYGVAVFSQGGMGTEYESDSWLAARTGQDVRSELGVGRLMFPLAYNVNDRLSVGGSIDYVWGGLDMKMAMPVDLNSDGTLDMSDNMPGSFGDFLMGQVLGEATVTMGLGMALNGAIGMGYDTVAINFSDSGDFTQETSGAGFAGKIGAVYKINSQWSIGASYHMKTAMSDWEGDAEMVFYDVDGANPENAMDGSIKIKDFQWPATIAVGAAFTPSDRLLVAADVKVLQWSDVMKDFTMVFEPDAMPGESAEIVMYQDWDDQTVFSLGASYGVTDQVTVRAGANISNNPIPDEFVHPMFPAIIENHYTAGLGYAFSEASDINFSLAYAPEVSVTNENTGTKIKHSQTNWQLMYSHRF
jgi:long-chain fatty acid transport protein